MQLLASKSVAQKEIANGLNDVTQRFGYLIENVVINIALLDKARIIEVGHLKNFDLVIEQINKLREQGMSLPDGIKNASQIRKAL